MSGSADAAQVLQLVSAAVPIVFQWGGEIVSAIVKYHQGQIDEQALTAQSRASTDAMVERLKNIAADTAARNAAVDARVDEKFPPPPFPTPAAGPADTYLSAEHVAELAKSVKK